MLLGISTELIYIFWGGVLLASKGNQEKPLPILELMQSSGNCPNIMGTVPPAFQGVRETPG